MKFLKFTLITILFFQSSISISQIKLPQLISDGMVLQRDQEIKVWGWASPEESIILNFKSKKFKTKASKNGNWSIILPAQKAGGPHKMTFKGKNKIVVNDVLFGDVWLCSGQSNMTVKMERVKEKYPNEIANANYPNIHYYYVSTITNLKTPQSDLPAGEWKSVIPENIMEIGAIPYFFAKDIYKKYHVPIGMINASVGGTPIESWISENGFKEFPKELETIKKNKDTGYTKTFTTRPVSNNNAKPQDKGSIGPIKWYEESYVPKGWNNFNIPGYWEDQGVKNLNGVVWFRKEIEIPESMIGEKAKLFMGRIVDADIVYVNGTKVGNITYQYPPRRYTVPSGVLKKGKNVITVRVTNYGGKGGFVPDKPYNLIANGETIDLEGDWKYKVGEVFVPNTGDGNGFNQFWSQNQPTSLYNAMVAPVLNQKIKGILWYQGESNTGNPKPYEGYLKALIKDWRQQLNQRELPFLYVQLANFQDVDYLPTESNWAELRDAQFQALSIPNTAMAVTTDLGEWNDIHPLDKENVGKRLALGALKFAYGENIVHSGPIFKSSEIYGTKIIISFDSVGSGLISNDDEPLNRFEIAGENQKFVWADAKIVGNTVEVKSESISNPKYVRYAWADNPLGANLYNMEGLPTSPFRNYNPNTLNDKPWQGKKAAVILTYDDALNVHLDNAALLLDSLGLKGTFYISSYSEAFRKRIKDWKKLAQNGHELGNHTIFHPCTGNDNRTWVNENYDMGTYTVDRMVDEIRINNTLLEALDGKKERTFAYTCGDFTVGGNRTFMDQLKGDLVAARSVSHGFKKIDEIDLYSINCYSVNGQSGEELIALAKKAMESNSLLVFLFHGVGGEHDLNADLESHKQLLEFLKLHENDIWTTTMLEVVENIKKNQSN
ncbi:sialate O-acetylesterase [Lutibacter flavus]|uniref:Sialate O-acetylesterase n=1 Tax=Lutibacter flavus TaxID=691689 RepID=A0A238XJS7_9FLAO|nr:sialate O-acetylesterase [Lutibacter flavus]SNR58970.1 sialate O-acetylesterase [Lutibacter flavus]